jgi:hypothetical protein
MSVFGFRCYQDGGDDLGHAGLRWRRGLDGIDLLLQELPLPLSLLLLLLRRRRRLLM